MAKPAVQHSGEQVTGAEAEVQRTHRDASLQDGIWNFDNLSVAQLNI